MNSQIMKHKTIQALGIVALFCGLAACGGGGSNAGLDARSADSSTPPLPAPVAVTAPAGVATSSKPVATDTTVTDYSCGLNGAAGIQAEVLNRVNALRASGAVCGSTTYAATTPLSWSNLLLIAAKVHSSDMAQNKFFSHTGSDGTRPSARIGATGYDWSNVGENIAAGQMSVEEVINGWAKSPGHCTNMMKLDYKDVAVACVKNTASASNGLYWTMTLGRSYYRN